MNKHRIGILLLALSIALMNIALIGCSRKRVEEEMTTPSTTTDRLSSILPSTDTTTTPIITTEGTSRSETEGSMSENTSVTTTEQSAATTTHRETTAKTETTTNPPETTTTKTEITTEKPATTTTKTETTTTKTETTTQKQETTTRPPETTIIPQTTIVPQTTVVPPVTTPNSTVQTEPQISAGEWLHFEAFQDKHLGAGVYLGISAQAMSVTEIIDRFGLPLTAQDITVIDNGDSEDAEGDEWYLILPRHRDTIVRVYEAETQRGKRTAGELLAEGMHPMLIRCEAENGKPDVFVELIRGEEHITFPLRTDRESGKADFHDRLLDITPAQRTRKR